MQGGSMKKHPFMAALSLTAVLILGFIQPAGAAEQNPQSTIQILFEDGVSADTPERQARSQSQLAEWMKNDLVRVFGRYTKDGFQGKLIEQRKDFTPQTDNYLLVVKIVEYKAGSKAARIIVGYGAGGVTLRIHYELFANNSKSILAQDDSVFSGREWINAARKLNEKTAKTVTEKLKNK